MGERPYPEPTTDKQALPTDRLVSLDAYRGFTMLAMVSGGLGMGHLLKDPTWGPLADQLSHREWVGCTAWDLIQPSFMFIVGVAMPFAFARRQERGDTWRKQFAHVLWRAMLLVLIGWFLDSYSEQHVVIQMIRVLQQIAIGYVLAFLVLHLRPRVQFLTVIGILVIHAAAFYWYGWLTGNDPWAKDQNLGAYVDTWIHEKLTAAANWLFQALFHTNPTMELMPVSKGGYVTLNALSSTATILFGVLCGELLRSSWSPMQKLAVLFVAGVTGLVVGVLLAGGEWDLGFVRFDLPTYVPMVKRIWTSSFAVYAAGWTFLLMFLFYAVIDVIRWQRWAFPFVVVGMNSIAIYVFAGTVASVVKRGLGAFLNDPMLHFAPQALPVVMAALLVAAGWLFCYWLYRLRVFLKV
jgi:heparan-alpha-glucosaminide N-acetyltransferase